MQPPRAMRLASIVRVMLTCNVLCGKKSEADLRSITSATAGGDSLLGVAVRASLGTRPGCV